MSRDRLAPEAVRIEADGALLAGRRYRVPVGTPRGAILLAGATGITQGFYTAFAQWTARRGYEVLTFDFRGIGESLGAAHVRDSLARKQDWGERDLPAALDWLLAATGAGQVDLIGHSAGGQLMGLMPNHRRLRRVVAVSSLTGYVPNIHMPDRWLARFLLGAYIPATCRVLGYAPSRLVGFGEDLPRGVARQWAKWCLSPGYVENDFGRSIARHYYAEFAAPIHFLHATDDPIATAANVADLRRLLPRAPQTDVPLDPSAFGLEKIGHIDLFRRRCEVVWPSLLGPIEAST